MNPELQQTIDIELPPKFVRYVQQYQQENGLSSFDEVFVYALKALRREQLTESYKQAAEDYAKNPDRYAELEGYDDEIAISDGSEWL